MKTLFEEVQEELKFESGQSGFFYRRALRSIASRYSSDPKRIIFDETKDMIDKDHQDRNVIRTFPKPGHLLFFDYQPKSRYSKFADKFPCAYVMSLEKGIFTAANLHFIEPNKRKVVIEQLQKNRILFPQESIAKYSIKQVQGLYLDIATEEWNTAAFLPVENFVSIKEGKEKPVNVVDVWKETDRKSKKMFGATRTTKQYSTGEF